ncbi:MAG: THUMP-like domain-containing protein [Bacteroidales bacterium]
MLKTDTTTLRFINEHMQEDAAKLLLAASRYPDLDMAFIADQILARKQIKDKLPEWYANPDIILPSRIAAEQCSSYQTAAYKQRLIAGDTVCDLTGGLGADTYYISKATRKSFYIERFAEYCEAARHNFCCLNANHIEVIHADSQEIEIPFADTIYLDPARRSGVNKRLFDLQECEPDIVGMRSLLFEKAKRIVVKVSPMADISRTLSLLPETREIHVLSVKNECKELILLLDKETVNEDVQVVCVNYNTDGSENTFSFFLQEEENAFPEYAFEIGKFLYEPNASIMKSGAFRSISTKFNLQKLHINSHLYTSDAPVENFPGRIFRVTQTHDFASSQIKKLSGNIPKANITVRNFPLSVDELRKKTKIKEGGSTYLFATTIQNGKKVLIEGLKFS